MKSSNSSTNSELAKFTIVSDKAENVVSNGASAQICGSNIATNGSVLALNAHEARAEIYYDEYSATFGVKTRQITQSELDAYVKAGWMTYKVVNGKPECKILNEEKCPIEKIEKVVTLGGNAKAYECQVCMYKYYGYTSMPRFLAGTDVQGRDMFKYALHHRFDLAKAVIKGIHDFITSKFSILNSQFSI